jgi:hypothetical protein
MGPPVVLASEFLDRRKALGDRSRHPVTPRFVGVVESSFRDHSLDRRHAAILPMAPTATRRRSASIPAHFPLTSNGGIE